MTGLAVHDGTVQRRAATQLASIAASIGQKKGTPVGFHGPERHIITPRTNPQPVRTTKLAR